MSLYSTIPAPEAAVDEESLLTAKPKKSTRWAATLAAVCLASALVGSATPGAVGKLYNLATSSVTLVDSQRLRDPTQNQAVPIRAVAMTQAGDGGSTQMVATASGNNYFSGTSYDGGSGRQRSDSRQLGRYEWIATYEGLSIYGHTSGPVWR
jgi:hypothetical protein